MSVCRLTNGIGLVPINKNMCTCKAKRMVDYHYNIIIDKNCIRLLLLPEHCTLVLRKS